MRRPIHLALVLAVLASLSIMPGSSIASSGSWKRISSKHGSRVTDEQIGLIRRSGGALGVAWVDHTGGSSALKLSTISAAGTIKETKSIVTGWNEIGGPDAVPSAGKLSRIFFSGRKASTGPRVLRSALALSKSSPYEIEPEVRATGDGIGGANVGGGATASGNPLVSWASSFGVRVHYGLTPSENFDFQQPVGVCCAYSPDIASSPGGGGTNIGWYSNAGKGHVGVYAASVNPFSGAPSGPPMLMPGSANAPQLYSRTPIAGRPTRGGVYMAYRTGKDGDEVRVWLIGSNKSTVLGTAKPGSTINGVGIAADSRNRLWVFWGVSTIFGGKVFFSRSDAGESKPGVLSFNNPKSISLPKGVRIIDQLYGSAQTGKLDLVAKFRRRGTNSWWHRQVAP